RSIFRIAGHPRSEEKAVQLGVDRLVETAARRRYSGRGTEESRQHQGHSAAVRGPAEKRAGRAPARASCLCTPPRDASLSCAQHADQFFLWPEKRRHSCFDQGIADADRSLEPESRIRRYRRVLLPV